MGGCCGKVALAHSLLSNSADEEAVVAKVQNVLNARQQNSQLAYDVMAPTFDNCMKTHGSNHAVTALAAWAVSRCLRMLAVQAGEGQPTKVDRASYLKEQEKYLRLVDAFLQNGGDFPPIEGEPFFLAEATQWPGYRASRIASQLSVCISQQGPARAAEVCELLERVCAATDAAEGASHADKISAKLDLAGVIHQFPAKADAAIQLMTELLDHLADTPAENGGEAQPSRKGADPQLFDKVAGKLSAMLSYPTPNPHH